jgi:hypothetical protein
LTRVKIDKPFSVLLLRDYKWNGPHPYSELHPEKGTLGKEFIPTKSIFIKTLI